MQDNRLKRLVQEADARPPAAAKTAAEVAAFVRIIHGQRRRRRLVVTATAGLLLAGLLWRIAPHAFQAEKRLPEVAGANSIEPVKLEPIRPGQKMRALREQIDREEQIVRGLLAAERARRVGREAQEVSRRMTMPISHDEQIGPAAAGYLVSGDRKREAGLPVAAAQADYAHVVELFPETIWASQAKARLALLKP